MLNFPLLIMGDPHFKINNLDVARQLFDNITTPETLQRYNTLIIMGDIYDSKSIIYAEVQKFCLNEIRKITQKHDKKVIVLVGNHDWANLNFTTHALEPLKLLDGTTVVDDYLLVDDILFVSYNAPAHIEEILLNNRAKLVLGHFNFKGDDYGNGIISIEGVAPGDYGGEYFILGHFHTPTIGNPCYIGSPFSHSFGEKNQQKRLIFINNMERDGDFFADGAIVENLPRHIEIDYSLETDILKKDIDYIKYINIPHDKLFELKMKNEGCQNIQYVESIEEKNDVRISAELSEAGMIKEYIDKNYLSEKFNGLHQDQLLNMSLKILEKATVET